MRVGEVLNFLNDISPFELQESWDNSGLIVGNSEKEVKKIYLTLDVDDSVIESVENGSLIIAHHPLIFKGLKRVNGEDFSSKYLIELIKRDISFIAMHTNFDKTHLNRFFATEILGFEGESEDFVFYSEVNMSFEEVVKRVKDKLGLNSVKTVKTKDFIKRVAITTGSGMGLLSYIKADLFLTGDIKYHDAMDAKARGISLIDIGHYESERFFVDVMYKEIKDLKVEIIKLNSQNPFSLI
jgi:dinuclear metal center YbgI/SA1388 family protein